MNYGDYMKLRNKKAVTFIEVMIVIGLFNILMLAAYKLFFSEIKTIKTSLEHIGVNESARKFFTFFGNDVRNANWVDFPKMIKRDEVGKLKPITEGKVCVLRRQVMNFEIKPPQADFLCEEVITYTLKKNANGSSDLYRHVKSDLPGQPPRDFEKKLCEDIVEMIVFTTTKKPVILEKSLSVGTLKKHIKYEPYESNGTGPYLVHAYTAFTRKSGKPEIDAKSAPVKITTCFAVRGKLNGVHP